MRNRSSGFPTRSDTNRAVQPQKMARGLKFRTLEVEGLYYLYSQNKGADQLAGYHEADLRLLFAYAKIRFSHDVAHLLIIFYCCTTRFVSGLIRNLVYFTTLRNQII